MHESSKSMRRRWCEDQRGVFPWREIFKGCGLDVGCSDDKLPFPDCTGFDMQGADVNGDANRLSTYFEPSSFDYLHASQCLEHLHSPPEYLEDWLKLLAPGGNLIITVPDFDLYEKRVFPSRWNGDHKAAFSLWREGFPGMDGKLYHVPWMLAPLNAEIRLCRLVTTRFDWNAPEDRDQTFVESDGVECWIEFVLRKIPTL